MNPWLNLKERKALESWNLGLHNTIYLLLFIKVKEKPTKLKINIIWKHFLIHLKEIKDKIRITFFIQVIFSFYVMGMEMKAQKFRILLHLEFIFIWEFYSKKRKSIKIKFFMLFKKLINNSLILISMMIILDALVML